MKIYQDKFIHQSLLDFSAFVDGYVVLINKKTKKAKEEAERHKLPFEYAKTNYGVRYGEDAYDFGVTLNDNLLADFQMEIDNGNWFWAEGATLADKLLSTMSHLQTYFIIKDGNVIFVRNNRNVILLGLPSKQSELVECINLIKQEQKIDWNEAKLYYDADLRNFYISERPEPEFEKEGEFTEMPFNDNITILEIKDNGRKQSNVKEQTQIDDENDTSEILYDVDIQSQLLPRNVYDRQADDKDFALDKPFSENGINFVAIDLETATFERDSICEVGITVVENSKIAESRSWLIQPPGNEYDEFNISIHGINPKETKNCPEFDEIWPEIKSYLDGKIVVAHNTAFDMYVLRDTFWWNDIKFPNFAFFCSYRAATKQVKGCYSYSLPDVCEALNIAFDGHHRAGNDAKACAEVFLKCLELSGCKSFDDFQHICGFRCGRFSDNYFRPQLSTGSGKAFKVGEIKGDPAKIDEGNFFYGKRVCFTGACIYGTRKELLQKIADVGGIPTDAVTKSTDVLIVGEQDYRKVGESGMSSKQKKAMALKDSGCEIEIMSEKEFLENM